MSQEQAAEFIKQAGTSIEGGEFSKALDLLDQALALTPDDPDAHGLRGIALSQIQRPDEATAAFRRAITLSPTNAKAYFNLAVHLYGQGQKVESLEMAKEAARLDLSHAGSRDLAARIESEMGAPAASAPGPPVEGTVAYPRPGYDENAGHSVALVEKMGAKWVPLGVVLILISMVVFGVVLAYIVPLMMSGVGNPNFAEEMQKAQGSQPGYLQTVAMIGWLNRALLLTWMIMDILDRRASFFWLLTVVPCCCCLLEWIGPIVYILFGRKAA